MIGLSEECWFVSKSRRFVCFLSTQGQCAITRENVTACTVKIWEGNLEFNLFTLHEVGLHSQRPILIPERISTSPSRRQILYSLTRENYHLSKFHASRVNLNQKTVQCTFLIRGRILIHYAK